MEYNSTNAKEAICIHNANLLTGFSLMENCAVYIEDGKIVDVFSQKRLDKRTFPSFVKMVDAKQNYVSPGFIDTHIHGIGGFGTEDCDSSSVLAMSKILPRFGTTSFIPTIYSSPEEKTVRAIKSVVSSMNKEEGAKILGLHLEGPFLSKDKAGAQAFTSDVDIALMKRFLDVAKGNIINMTVAPELKNMRDLALFCIGEDIILQAGHTNATYEQMVEGMQSRIMHSTHLFNAMSQLHHRGLGAVGTILIHPEMSCEIIADGVHIDKHLIKFVFKSKPLDRIVLVTDAIKPAKQEEGVLLANNEEVYFNKAFHLNENTIAGSALTMIEGVKNLVEFGIPIEKAIKTATANPANILKIVNKGLIAPGYDGDLVVFDKNIDIIATVIGGKEVYNSRK